ncbi:LL-diaminopimelate aminotransferase [uncultured archaeon]|nr:LL-diaminopimelate aminotransferase [uncultured archaeon]
MKVSLSSRIQSIPPYLFAEIDRAIEVKRKSGVDVISLGIGDPDLPTPPHIVEALRVAAGDKRNHQYPSYQGLREFREAVAGWYKKRFNVALDSGSEVVSLIGSKEGIGHLPLALVDPGDVVLYTDPGYPVYKIGTILAGGKPVPISISRENNFLPDLSAVPKDSLKKAKLLFVCYPNNPTGATAEKEFYKEVVDFAVDNNIVVAHDAAYSEVAFGGYKPMSFLEVAGAKDVGIEFHSLSKTYNMTGWRIGMVVGNPDVVRALGKVKENVDSGVFQAVQIAGVAALNGSQKCVSDNMKILEKRRDNIVKTLSGLGWDVRPPKASYYIWFPVPTKGISSVDFAKTVLDKAGVVVTPGVGFGQYGEGYIRISITQSDERINEALERLKKLKV